MELNDRAQAYLQRMDLVVRAAEIKWGILFALERLVPPELAAKFQAQWQKLSGAVMAKDYDEVIVHADGVIRGVWALEKVALEMGHVPEALSGIGLGVPVMLSEEDVIREYVESGRPMDEELGF